MTVQDCFVVNPGGALSGSTTVPGDKSISHRAVLFGALAEGETHVRGWLAAGDTEASLRAVQALGVPVERISQNELTLHGGRLHPPAEPLNLVNAGTGIRLLAGILVGQPFESTLDGSEQLRRRPMDRIINPLEMMGASINGSNGRAPLHIRPAALRGIRYHMPVASAQVKSAILLAGLFAEGETAVIQPGPARDHTERMLSALGASLTTEHDTITLTPGAPLRASSFTVPGDISSAAFLMVAALLVPGSDVLLTHINLNPTRTGVLDVLREMGADVTITPTGEEAGEPVGNIRLRYSALKGVHVHGDTVVRMIDEFPVFMVAALMAEGETTVSNAEELRVKETDRLSVMSAELRKLGAHIVETEDGFIIHGPQKLTGAVVHGNDDHRVAMSLTVAGLAATGQTTVLDAKCAADSFPGYAETLRTLGGDILVREVSPSE